MSAIGWVAAAIAALLSAPPAIAPGRVRALRAAGRLGGLPSPELTLRGTRWGRVAATALLGATTVVAVIGGAALAVAAGAVAGASWLVARDAARARAQAAGRAELLAAVRVLVAELEAGGRPGAALAAAARASPGHAPVLAAAARAAQRGGAPSEALIGATATRSIGLAWRLEEQTGAPLVGVLTRVAADLVAAQEQARTVAVALSGPRSSALLLAALPAIGITLGVAMGAQPVAFLLGAPAGRLVCCVGVLLDVAGVLWMRRILHRAEAR